MIQLSKIFDDDIIKPEPFFEDLVISGFGSNVITLDKEKR